MNSNFDETFENGKQELFSTNSVCFQPRRIYLTNDTQFIVDLEANDYCFYGCANGTMFKIVDRRRAVFHKTKRIYDNQERVILKDALCTPSNSQNLFSETNLKVIGERSK